MDVTWEDKEELLQRFPLVPAWGQAATQGGGDVSIPLAPEDKKGEMGLVTGLGPSD